MFAVREVGWGPSRVVARYGRVPLINAASAGPNQARRRGFDQRTPPRRGRPGSPSRPSPARPYDDDQYLVNPAGLTVGTLQKTHDDLVPSDTTDGTPIVFSVETCWPSSLPDRDAQKPGMLDPVGSNWTAQPTPLAAMSERRRTSTWPGWAPTADADEIKDTAVTQPLVVASALLAAALPARSRRRRGRRALGRRTRRGRRRRRPARRSTPSTWPPSAGRR